MIAGMSYELFSALAVFAFVTSITPGPNNLMLMSSGANFGLRRSVPHMLGIGAGFVVMILLVGMGLAQVFDRFPISYVVLKIASLIYLCFLAWKIANAAAPEGSAETGTPMTFLQAAAFQWVNPKAWTMALAAISAYAPDQSLQSIGMVAAVFGAINLPAVSSWTLLGTAMSRILTNPRRLRAFNWTMAGLLVASLVPVLLT